MVVQSNQTVKKYVFASNEVPEECVKRAQVVIVGAFSWHLIAPAPYRMHCMLSFAPMPAVNCPVIDVKNVSDDEGMARVMAACADPTAGVINLDGLLTGLEALGAKVSKSGTQVGSRQVEPLDVTKLKKVRRVRRKERVQ